MIGSYVALGVTVLAMILTGLNINRTEDDSLAQTISAIQFFLFGCFIAVMVARIFHGV